jgi:hypothetical protein
MPLHTHKYRTFNHFSLGAGGLAQWNVKMGEETAISAEQIRAGTPTEQLLRPEFRNKPSRRSYAGAPEQAGCTDDRQENIVGEARAA